MGELCFTITSGTEFQLPKNTPSPLDVTHYRCSSSSGSMPIRLGNQPLYCHFLSRIQHSRPCVWAGFTEGTKHWMVLHHRTDLLPVPPLCFLRFLIPSAHLLCFILQSSLALLPSWALGLVLCLQRSLVYSAKGRTICSNWGKWQRLYHVALSFLSPVGKGRMEVLIFSLMGYAPGLHLQPWKAGILDFT